MLTSTETLYEKFLLHPQVSTDTRNIHNGSIFFALKGENFNGNAFAAEALQKGAAYAVVDEANAVSSDRTLLVENVLQALQDLARHHRRTLGLPVIGITGSNGKTTTKELVAAVLAKKFRTLYTKGNLNNHIGVPLTLLSLTRDHEIAVVEMGANHQLEIKMLSEIAEPNYGLITNIGLAHLEGFGGPEGVLKGKTELFDFLRSHEGTAFVLADDPKLLEKSETITRVLYGTLNNAEVQGRLLDAHPFVEFEWTSIRYKTAAHTVQTKIVGTYNLPNMLAAVTVGLAFGVPAGDINAALESYVPEMNRSQVIEKNGNTIVMDAYNANPSSMVAALRNFKMMEADQKLIILGDMRELGDESNFLHETVIKEIQKLRLLDNSQLLLVGSEFKKHAPAPAATVPDSESAKLWLQQNRPENMLILVKGSRGMRLEKVLDVL